MAIRPLNRVPIPVDGENAYGYMRRFAACLGYEGIDPFRHAIKLREFGPTSEPWRWERLAALAGFPVEDLLPMRWRDPATQRNRSVVTFLGHQIRSTHLAFTRMRFCPSCFAEDGAREQRILRDHWSLFMAPVCSRHGTLLVDGCDHCGEGFDHRRKAGVWSCGCGREMIDIKPGPASNAAKGITLALQSSIGASASGRLLLDRSGRFRQPFFSMPLSDLASVIDRIGTIAATPANADRHVSGKRLNYRTGRIDQERTIAQCATQVEHAHRILNDWPASFEALIADVAGRNPTPKTNHKVRRLFATEMGQLLLDPLKRIDGKPVGVLDAVLRNWLRREHGYRWGQRVDHPKEGKRGIRSADPVARANEIAAIAPLAASPPPNKFEMRVNKLIKDDTFMQASKLNALIKSLWPASVPLDPMAEPGIRKRQETRTYKGRDFPRNLHSARDALRLMTKRLGPSPVLTLPQ